MLQRVYAVNTVGYFLRTFRWGADLNYFEEHCVVLCILCFRGLIIYRDDIISLPSKGEIHSSVDLNHIRIDIGFDRDTEGKPAVSITVFLIKVTFCIAVLSRSQFNP